MQLHFQSMSKAVSSCFHSTYCSIPFGSIVGICCRHSRQCVQSLYYSYACSVFWSRPGESPYLWPSFMAAVDTCVYIILCNKRVVLAQSPQLKVNCEEEQNILTQYCQHSENP